MGQRIYFARLEPTFRNQLGLGRGKSGKARFLSTKYQGALKKGGSGPKIRLGLRKQSKWKETIDMDEKLDKVPDVVIPGDDPLDRVTDHIDIDWHVQVKPEWCKNE